MLYSALPIITIPPASYKQALAPHTSDLISLFSWLQLGSYLKLYFFFPVWIALCSKLWRVHGMLIEVPYSGAIEKGQKYMKS